jgi:hypothetical protein
MAVAFDASSESHTGTTGSASEASFSWTHTPVGTPKGVLIFAFNNSDNVDDMGVVTYGGTSVPAVTGGATSENSSEGGYVKTYFLGSSVPTGAQTVVVNRTNNAFNMYAVCVTVTADANTAVYESGIQLVFSSSGGLQAEVSVDDGSPGTNSMRFAGTHTGFLDVPSAGASSTALQSIDYGSIAAAVVRETTAGQGFRTVGFTTGANDDYATVHLAVTELSAGSTQAPRSMNLYRHRRK